jgi:hypothetical protein
MPDASLNLDRADNLPGNATRGAVLRMCGLVLVEFEGRVAWVRAASVRYNVDTVVMSLMRNGRMSRILESWRVTR